MLGADASMALKITSAKAKNQVVAGPGAREIQRFDVDSPELD